jgi:hypothetical protein
VASNPGRIPAGGKDKISVVVYTKNRGGSHLNKSFLVYTNDPKKSQINLTVTGQVKAYVNISAKYIRFIGPQGLEMAQTIQLIPYKDYPLTIKKVTATEGTHLRYELKPLHQKDGPQGYELIVTNTMATEGSYQDTITIETDLKQMPKIMIPVAGRIQKAPQKAGKSSSE